MSSKKLIFNFGYVKFELQMVNIFARWNGWEGKTGKYRVIQKDGLNFVCLYFLNGGTVVKVLCYKSQGLWFDPSWCH